MGGNDSTTSSRPLTAGERADAYNAGISSIHGTLGGNYFTSDGQMRTGNLQYKSPTYQAQNGGDYAGLQQNIYNSAANHLNTSWNNRSNEMQSSMAKRGLWSIGDTESQIQKSYAEDFQPAYQQVAANAAQQRYTLQSTDMQNQNTFNQANADKEYNSKWRPLDYSSGLYNGTGGVVSSTNTSGWNI